MPDLLTSTAEWRLPTISQRLAVLGRTGSGKSMVALFIFAILEHYLHYPCYIFDWKGDDHIRALVKAGLAVVISIHDKPPRKPGIYVVRPLPEGDEDAVNAFLWEVWKRGKACVWFDEGYMVSKNSAPFRALLTQGRSKKIAMIVLAQRPVWMDRFVWSESDFICGLALADRDDIKTVQRFMPGSYEKRLDEYNAYWYDVGKDRLTQLLPVPPRDEILAYIRARIRPEVIRSRIGVEHRYL